MKGIKPYLSSTNIQVFVNCKRRYKYKYIDKININIKQASKYLSFGNSIHAALAQFNMITDEKYRTIEILHKLLRKNWNRDGYASIDEEKEYGIKALNMLSNYFNDPKDQGKKNMIIEEMIKKDMDGKFVLLGKLDKSYIRNDGLLETVDYKTGANIEAFNAMQMPIYILLTKEKLGCYPDLISNYYIAHNKKLEQEVTSELIESVTKKLWDIYYTISLEKEFLANPTHKCQAICEYYEICDSAKDKNSIMMDAIINLDIKEDIDTVF